MNTAVKPQESIRTGPMFTVMITGAFVAFLNQTLINIALPQIMDQLKISAVTANWLTTIYMLVNGIVIPITAYLLERFTTKQLYLFAMISFTIGTVLCAVAPTFSFILLGRVVQAAGAGILFPLITNVIFMIFPENKRGSAMGLFGVAINFAPAVGPTLSGWIVESYSWRVLFYVIVPIALINLLFGAFLIQNVSETSRPKLDVLGVIFSTIGFGGVLYGFADAGSVGWGDREVVAMFIVGGISLVLFIWRQFSVNHPILEFHIFQHSMFSLTTIVNVVVTMAMFSGMILMPIYMQNVRGFSPLESGFMLLPGGILMGIMSPITGKLFDKIGAKWLAIPGLLITVVTTYGLTRLEPNTSFTYVTVLYTIRMFGMSILMMPIFTAGLNALPLSMNRYGTAMVNTLRMMAGAIGMAFFVSIMANRGATHIRDLVSQQHMPIGMATSQGTCMGINDAFLVATVLSIVALFLSFFLRNTAKKTKLEQNNEPQKNFVRSNVVHRQIMRPSPALNLNRLDREENQPVYFEEETTLHHGERGFHIVKNLEEESMDDMYRAALRNFVKNDELNSEVPTDEENEIHPGLLDREIRQALRAMQSKQERDQREDQPD